MVIIDDDWTPRQDQFLLDRLKINCGLPDWKPEAPTRLCNSCSSHQEDATTVEGQLEFIAYELLPSFKALGILLKRAETVEEAKQAVQPYVRRLVSER